MCDCRLTAGHHVHSLSSTLGNEMVDANHHVRTCEGSPARCRRRARQAERKASVYQAVRGVSRLSLTEIRIASY